MPRKKKGPTLNRDLSNASMRISKLDAAHAQLQTAIWLYFQEMDPISVHTLASAARAVLRKLHAHHGTGHRMLHDELIDLYVLPEYRDSMIDLLTEAANFFKHATDDPEATLAFNPQVTESVMLDAVWAIQKLDEKDCVEYSALRNWLIAQNPNLLKEVPAGLSDELFASIRSLGRGEYFRMCEQEWHLRTTIPG